MAGRHLDALFSEAFDGALDDPGRRRFDDHLAACQRCRDAFADYSAALQAVRELPPARMSVPVVLPTTAPQLAVEPAAPRRRLALPGWLLRPGPMASGLGLAAAGIAAVVVAVHVGHGGNVGSGGGAALAQSAGGGASSASVNGAAGSAGTQLTAPDCSSFRVAAQGAAAPPQGFDNAVRQSDPSRPGQQLVLATSGSQVHAGDRVTIYARLVTPGASTAIVPCVTLSGAAESTTSAHGAAGAASGAPPAAAGVAPAAPAPAQRSQQVAEPTTIGGADSAPLLSIAIPPGLAPGTVLHLVAQIPASVPEPDNATVEAVLTITVS